MEKFDGIVRPIKEEDLEEVRQILSDWMVERVIDEVKEDEVNHYLKLIKSHFEGTEDSKKIDDNYLVAEYSNGDVVGIIGFRKPISKAILYSNTLKPCELNLLFVKKEHSGKGAGTALVIAMEKIAKEKGYTEIVVRSSEIYKDSSWGFYDKFWGFVRSGVLKKSEANPEDSQIWRKIL